MRKVLCLSLIAMLAVSLTAALAAPVNTRIKDLAKVQGVRSNQLVGYGLVVGLAGTGDSDKAEYTIQSIASMLKSFGITAPMDNLRPKNMAAVMITAELPPFAKPGDTIDIAVSSIGDAKSLQGGTLLQAPLKAANGQVYAVAQGALSIGGFSVSGGGSRTQKNFPTVGSVPSGAIVEQEVPNQIGANGTIALSLRQPDFTTANRIAEAVESRFGPISQARDPGTVAVTIPNYYQQNVVGFVAALEELYVRPDSVAKVVINERTGTVVMGSHVAVSEVAVAQGSLNVRIVNRPEVSQPAPFSDGETVVTEQQQITVSDKPASFIVLPSTANVGDVVNALNAVGATSRDVIAILQAMKAAGALHAEIQIM
ncbi:flagellar basal body P-ring protein FlgI [Acetonema longum]|uniref:Flagellar P-ring protein n=1 Tax=Acetonema longum DSM 6540 TaxID=1009370 RepID=F7NIV3_9FIRM|nr:flagellar basal body P-ring protein FlgI [Acetonema longum]EGO64076.1 flagellar basal body P-ring protein [Acetonema longum DSM 6540]